MSTLREAIATALMDGHGAADNNPWLCKGIEEHYADADAVLDELRDAGATALADELGVNLTRGPVPPWHLTQQAFAYLAEVIAGRGPVGRSELDQLQGTIRDELDKLEVNLHDEWVVYLGLVWTGLVTELARNGLAHQAIDRPTYVAIAEIATTIGAALMEYAPEEVRPR